MNGDERYEKAFDVELKSFEWNLDEKREAGGNFDVRQSFIYPERVDEQQRERFEWVGKRAFI